jgi:hypothetical protein
MLNVENLIFSKNFFQLITQGVFPGEVVSRAKIALSPQISAKTPFYFKLGIFPYGERFPMDLGDKKFSLTP